MEKGLLIKYGEIAIKGNNRYQFENVLIMNIKHALSPIGDFWISKEQGRYLVEPREELPETWVREAVDRACKVFGVIGVSPVDVFDDDSMESLKRMTLDELRGLVNEPLAKSVRILDYDKSNCFASDDEVKEYLLDTYGLRTPADIQLLSKDRREEILRSAKVFGASIRQLERMTGVGFSIIRRA